MKNRHYIYYSSNQSIMSLQIHVCRKLSSTFITVRIEVSCLFRFTPGANYRAHGPQLCDGSLILCCNRIRKFVTQREPTDRQTDREFNCRGHSNLTGIVELSGPTVFPNIFFQMKRVLLLLFSKLSSLLFSFSFQARKV